MSYRDVIMGSAGCHVGNNVQVECNNWFNSQVASHPAYTRGKIDPESADWRATFVCWVAAFRKVNRRVEVLERQHHEGEASFALSAAVVGCGRLRLRVLLGGK